MRKYFVISGLAATMIAGLVARAGTDTRSTSAIAARAFTLDQAILTALQRNPDILRAEQEIKRTKGVVIEIRAQALPHITPDGQFQWTDPKLGSSGGGIVGGGSPVGLRSDIFYA